MQVVKHAVRSLLKSPQLTLTSIALLGVGIGLNTALFSLYNAALLSPFPYTEPERLLLVQGAFPEQDVEGARLSHLDLEEVRSRSDALVGLASFGWEPFNLTIGDEPMSMGGAWVSSDFFDLLGVEPLIGRTFTEAESSPGGEPVMLLNERMWRQRFGADSGILGRPLLVNGEPRVVVGVMPMKAELAEIARFWIPVEQHPDLDVRDHRFVRGVGRLGPGATVAGAETEVATISSLLQEEFPEENRGLVLEVETLREAWFGGARQVLQVLLAMVLLVLLIACANLTILMLVRATNRQRDMALRTVFGATPGSLVLQTSIESVLVGFLGCLLGLFLGGAAARVLLLSMPIDLPIWFDLRIDLRVVLFTLTLTLTAVLIFSVIPLLRARRPRVDSLIQQGERSTGAPRGQRLQRVLVGAEVALSLALLVASGLMARSFLLVVGTPPGFDPQGALTFGLELDSDRYVDDAQRLALIDQVLERTAAVPGVRQVAAISRVLPLQGIGPSRSFVIEGRVPDDTEQPPVAVFQSVTPGYFETMGISLLQGRSFTRSDRESSLPVVMVDRELANRYWPDGGAIGERLRVSEGDGSKTWRTVVGVTTSVKQDGLDQDLRPTIYAPLRQVPAASLKFVARSGGDSSALAASIRRTVAEIAPEEPLLDVMTLDEIVEQSLWQWRFFSGMFWVAAGVALLLACVGLYGVMAYSTASKRREIGVRMAIGAQRRDVLRTMLGHGAVVLVTGLLLGLFAAWGLGQAMGSFLYGIEGSDPVVFVLALVLLSSVAMLAILAPSLRASRIDPQEALRID